ncbi:CAAX prenyl protease [Verticillium alfalfae VaMs.102]|uniref:intramembrane prenyl-peptidase Rce1 n=1 Tax=Verticillium alfalfae (strain VaMs.102 / ATCC MYA-4576 / FGSC 10136) TaxID=526221 RepID=C9SUQ6_VERA1|nr:CAAX prenyl protease [Verticillium alfalfae VaMs.102]EEY22521.1 CAAX prenyl protease [Verticillium alfalfae VaMs.102]
MSTTDAVLHPTTAFALLLAYTLAYVSPLYASSDTRPSPELLRNDPRVIRARIKSVLCSTALCSFCTFIILHRNYALAIDPLHAMGYWPLGVTEAASSVLLTAILFSAPLFETLVLDGAWKDLVSTRTIIDVWQSWTTWRNIVIGPSTEELLFRSASVPLFLAAHLSIYKTIFLSPIIFGMAHIHHFYEFRITHPRVPLHVAIARTILQFSYTTLFGAYATFLFLRTGSLLAAILVHAFCNAMGLPRFWGVVDPYWISHSDARAANACRLWSAFYYLMLLAGAWAWWSNLMALTVSSKSVVDMP